MGVGGWKGGCDWIEECLMVGVELQMHWGGWGLLFVSKCCYNLQ